jgi:hypothetical protein
MLERHWVGKRDRKRGQSAGCAPWACHLLLAPLSGFWIRLSTRSDQTRPDQTACRSDHDGGAEDADHRADAQ